MARTRFDDWPCSVARTVDLLGDAWMMLILRDAFLGVRRFEDFQSDLGIGRNVLTQRLNALVDAGVFARVAYQERPVRHEYRLTEKGRALFDIVLALIRFGDDWLAPDGAPLVLRDRETGDRLEPVLVDQKTGRRIDPRRIVAEPGPGLSAQERARVVRRLRLSSTRQPSAPTPRSRSALAMTDTDEKDIAPAASIGDSSSPKKG